MKKSWFWFLAVALTIAMVAFGCGKKDDDGDGTTTTTEPTVTYHAGTVSISTNYFVGTSEEMTITVSDDDLTGTSVSVTVVSTEDPTGVTLTLYGSAGTYSNTIGFTAGTTSTDELLVADGDAIIVSYADANPSATKTGSAQYFDADPFICYADLPIEASYAGIYLWSDTVTRDAANTTTFYEGTTSTKITIAASTTWSGWGYEFASPYVDISSYTYFCAAIKIPDDANQTITNMVFKLEDSSGTAIELSALAYDALVADGAWHLIKVPVTTISATIDETALKVIGLMAKPWTAEGGSDISGDSYYFDLMYFE